MYRNSYVEINEKALINNIKNIKENYPDYKYYFGVVKGNAYGHGDVLVKTMIEAGINYLAVSSLEEAISIRKQEKDIPILCFGYIAPKFLEVAFKNKVTLTIISYDYFKEIKDTKLNLKVHIKLNTGMNRIGIKKQEELENIIMEIKDTNLILEGIYTHFATSGVYDAYFDSQLNRFKELTKNIDLTSIPIVHLYNSLSLVKHKKVSFANGVRLGIAMYGFSANANVPENKLALVDLKRKIKLLGKNVSEVTINNNLKLEKVMSIYSEVIYITEIDNNEFVGYNAIHKAESHEYIATVQIGHADGITSAFKYVKINDKTYPIVAIYMDYISVKVDETVKVHDKVTIIGDGLTFSNVASTSRDTVHHLLVSITNRLPRVYVKKDGVKSFMENK